MRRQLPWILPLLLILAAFGSLVEGQTTTTAPAPSGAPPSQETKVLGTPPDLTGRWLAVGWITLTDGRAVSVPTFWSITREDGKPVMTHRFVTLPPAMKAELDKANADGKAWEPTPDDLKQLAAQWDSLPAEDIHVAKVLNELSAPDGFDESVKGEPRSKDAILLVRQRLDYDAKGAPVIRQVMVYSALAPSDGGYTGNFDSATVAAAPFPVPIAFKGTFRLFRVGDAPARGFLARIFDVFSGCGRHASSS